MKSINDDETEIAVRLLLRIFQLDLKNQSYFSLAGILTAELRHNPTFMRHVKVKKIIFFVYINQKCTKVFRHLSQPSFTSCRIQQMQPLFQNTFSSLVVVMYNTQALRIKAVIGRSVFSKLFYFIIKI